MVSPDIVYKQGKIISVLSWGGGAMKQNNFHSNPLSKSLFKGHLAHVVYSHLKNKVHAHFSFPVYAFLLAVWF